MLLQIILRFVTRRVKCINYLVWNMIELWSWIVRHEGFGKIFFALSRNSPQGLDQNLKKSGWYSNWVPSAYMCGDLLSFLNAPFIVNARLVESWDLLNQIHAYSRGLYSEYIKSPVGRFQFTCYHFRVVDIQETEIPLMSPAPSGDYILLCQLFCCAPTVVFYFVVVVLL